MSIKPGNLEPSSSYSVDPFLTMYPPHQVLQVLIIEDNTAVMTILNFMVSALHPMISELRKVARAAFCLDRRSRSSMDTVSG